MDLPQSAYLLSRILGLAKRRCRLLRKALSLVQKPKALKIFTTVYHSSHSLIVRKGIIFSFHTQDVKNASLPAYDTKSTSFYSNQLIPNRTSSITFIRK